MTPPPARSGPRVTNFTTDGLQNRTAWAAAGDGVLFYDPDGRGDITETRRCTYPPNATPPRPTIPERCGRSLIPTAPGCWMPPTPISPSSR